MIKKLVILLGNEEDIGANVFTLISIRSKNRLQLTKYTSFTLYSPLIADCSRETMCIICGIIPLNLLFSDKLLLTQ